MLNVSIEGPAAEIRKAADNKWVIVTRIEGQCAALVLLRDSQDELSVLDPTIINLADRAALDQKSAVDVADAWDRLNRAIQCVLTAQPTQMTEAANELEEARRAIEPKIIATLRMLPPATPTN